LFPDPPTTQSYTLSLHDALPILTGYLSEKIGKKNLVITGLGIFVIGSLLGSLSWSLGSIIFFRAVQGAAGGVMIPLAMALILERSEEHTSELQSRFDLVCRLLLE